MSRISRVLEPRALAHLQAAVMTWSTNSSATERTHWGWLACVCMERDRVVRNCCEVVMEYIRSCGDLG